MYVIKFSANSEYFYYTQENGIAGMLPECPYNYPSFWYCMPLTSRPLCPNKIYQLQINPHLIGSKVKQ